MFMFNFPFVLSNFRIALVFKAVLTTRIHQDLWRTTSIAKTMCSVRIYEQCPHVSNAAQRISGFLGEKTLLSKLNSFIEFFSGGSRNQVAELDQLSAEIMVTASPEKMKTSQYPFYNYRTTSPKRTHNFDTMQLVHVFERRNTKSYQALADTAPS